MTTNFSFGALLRHMEGGTTPSRSASSPTEQHMREVMEAYVAAIGRDRAEFTAKHVAADLTGADPVGSEPSVACNGPEVFTDAIARLVDVPFKPIRAEMTAPVSFSLENKAAMAFKFWAEVSGRNISIDIVDVMTFNAAGKICDIRAYWGVENVTFLD